MKVSHKCNQIFCLCNITKVLGRKHHNVAGILFILFTLWLLVRINVLSIVDFAKSRPKYSGLNKGSGYDGNGNAIQFLLKQNISACNNSFVGYGNEFAVFSNIILNPAKNGGFIKKSSKDQWTAPKNIIPTKGYFSLKCVKKPDYEFYGNNHLNTWFSNTDFDPKLNVKSVKVEPQLTIAVKRYEYANLFHSMTDFYNAFLMMKLFNGTPAQTNILFLDTHPKGLLIDIWYNLFNTVTFAADLKVRVKYKKLVWSIIGYNSPLNAGGKTPVLSQIAFSIFNDWTPLWMYTNPLISYLSDFKKFVLSQFHIPNSKNLNCKNLTVLFIWRRDYVSHVHNPTGYITRKIQNEGELLKTTENFLKGHHVRGIQLDKVSVKEQLNLISTTDICIGMHGAALSYALFLPDQSALLELYPRYWPTTNLHFRSIAHWRNLTYFSWQNTDYMYEKKRGYTYIPPIVLGNMVKAAQNKLCPHSK
ncbi:beta-1,2-xylosyltransferase RCN11-like [Argonauta hians]